MVDPQNFTNFNRTDAELEEMWLFSCAVAGKTAATQARLLDNLLRTIPPRGATPFEKIRKAHEARKLLVCLKVSRLGQYRRLRRCYAESLTLDLRNDSLERFEAIHGVGPKTARMFLMHSRPDQHFAAIDTHILKHLRAQGIEAPRTTPTAGATYQRLEKAFLELAQKARMSPADYDLQVWRQYANA